MAISVQCSNANCKVIFVRPDQDATKRVSCPWCGHLSTVPRPGEVADSELTGDYKLIRPLTRGGMGEIYEAVQLRLNRRVALKVIAPRLSTDQAFVARFQREAKAAASLNHPNLVHVFDFGVIDERPFFAMEFIDGHDLSSVVMTTGKLPVSDVLRIAEDVAGALQEALKHGLIHRDIKPGNILMTSSGIVKVTDLGLARHIDGKENSLTATGVGIGTPHFISPEQATDAHSVDHRADIYSLGITMLYLLTGKRPFDGPSAVDIMKAQMEQPLPSAAELGGDVPAEVERIVRRMAEKKPSDRYQDYGSLIADLQSARFGRPSPPRLSPEAAAKLEKTTRITQRPGSSAPSTAHRPRTGGTPISSTLLQRPKTFGLLVGGFVLLLTLPFVYIIKRQHDHRLALEAAVNSAKSKAESGPTLSTDDVKAIETFMGEPGIPRGQTPPSPLRPLEPIVSPLTDGPVDKMLAEAKQYAEVNPTEYRDVIARFEQVRTKAAGKPAGAEAKKLLDEWTAKRDLLAGDLIEVYNVRANQIRGEEGHFAAMTEWRSFPDALRAEKIDILINARVAKIPVDADSANRGPRRGGPPTPPR
ncbi:MAG TPA: serine/threonine-protein kinase [Roseimicrobium sp.]|nr:serine/threonine-protein kinase [Roseimicrobium sp.]